MCNTNIDEKQERKTTNVEKTNGTKIRRTFFIFCSINFGIIFIVFICVYLVLQVLVAPSCLKLFRRWKGSFNFQLILFLSVHLFIFCAAAFALFICFILSALIYVGMRTGCLCFMRLILSLRMTTQSVVDGKHWPCHSSGYSFVDLRVAHRWVAVRKFLHRAFRFPPTFIISAMFHTNIIRPNCHPHDPCSAISRGCCSGQYQRTRFHPLLFPYISSRPTISCHSACNNSVIM
jgi:hypothetical protein